MSNLLSFLDQVTGLVDKGYSLDIIYLDLAKAFDKVLHQRLLNKLKAYGVRGKLHTWIAEQKNYRMTWINLLSGQISGKCTSI